MHLSSIGHSIIGDPFYEPRLTWYAGRTMLHAMKLHLPLKDFDIDIETEDPFGTLVMDIPYTINLDEVVEGSLKGRHEDEASQKNWCLIL